MSRLSGKNVLVLGGAGFIGSNLVTSLHNAKPASLTVADNFFLGNEDNFLGPEVSGGAPEVFRIDASDFSSLLRLVQSKSIDLIFNLAVVPLPTSLEFPSWTISTNIAITTNCCELLRSGFVDRLIHISSSEVYGSASVVPMDEGHPFNPSTPYAASKSASDQVVLSYVHTFGIDAQILRPFNNYGPRQNSGTYAGIFPILIRHAMNETEVGIFGDGNQTRDYVFVQDSVNKIIELAQISDRFETPVNVATGLETSVNDLVSLVEEAMKCNIKRVYLPPRRGDVLRHCGDTSLLVSLTGSAPPPIDASRLQRTIEWYVNSWRK